MTDSITSHYALDTFVAGEQRRRAASLIDNARPTVEEFGIVFSDLDTEIIADEIVERLEDTPTLTVSEVAMLIIEVAGPETYEDVETYEITEGTCCGDSEYHYADCPTRG